MGLKASGLIADKKVGGPGTFASNAAWVLSKDKSPPPLIPPPRSSAPLSLLSRSLPASRLPPTTSRRALTSPPFRDQALEGNGARSTVLDAARDDLDGAGPAPGRLQKGHH